MGFPAVTNLNYDDIFSNMNTIQDVIDWCINHGILHQQRLCPVCHRQMTVVKKSNSSDGVIWQCHFPCRKRLSIRKDTFLEGRLPLKTILKILYYWAYESSSQKFLQRECRISKNSIL